MKLVIYIRHVICNDQLTFKKLGIVQTFLAVQWLRFHTSNVRGMSSISCPGMNISQAVRPKKKKKKNSYCPSNWSRKWQCSPVFLPGKFHGERSLAGCSQWGHKESDMTEQLSTHTCPSNILDLSLSSLLPFFFFFFFWPCCEATLGLSSPTRDQTHTPCIGSTES